ncbi:hypothetical protein Bhyg_06301, partial [Pseudolycoriella hygida]
FGIAFGVTIPLIRKWDDQDSPLRKELESKISLTSVVMLSITGAVANYSYVIIFLIIIVADMMERQGTKMKFSYKYMAILHATMILIDQILATLYGFVLLATQENENFTLVLEVYLGSTPIDGGVISFYVTYWFFLQNIADRINFINERLRNYSTIIHNLPVEQLELDSRKNHFIIELAALHAILLNIINKINRCYTVQ